jgi:hypothetical protein
MSGEVNVVALVRGEEQYIFVFDEANRTETLRMLGRYAADPELSFTWFDAALLSQRVRELMPANGIPSSPSQAIASQPSASSNAGQGRVVTKSGPRFKLS